MFTAVQKKQVVDFVKKEFGFRPPASLVKRIFAIDYAGYLDAGSDFTASENESYNKYFNDVWDCNCQDELVRVVERAIAHDNKLHIKAYGTPLYVIES